MSTFAGVSFTNRIISMKKLYTLALALLLGVSAAGAAEHLTNLIPTEPAAMPYTSSHLAQKAPAVAEPATPHNWQAIGTCKYTDDLLTALFEGLTPATYDVQVEKDAANEGYYRIVEPIRSNPDIARFGAYISDDEALRYLVIDATDPANVIIEPSDLGIVVNGEEMYIYSYSWMAKTGEIDASLIDKYGLKGSLENNVVSFPGEGSLWLTYASIDANGRGFTADENGAWKLALPGAKDYSLELLGGSWCPVDGKALVSAWAGADVAAILAGAVTDPNDETQLRALLQNPVRLTSQQGALIDLPAGLKPCQPVYILALAIDGAGSLQTIDYTIVYAPDATEGWKDLPGKARFYDYTVTHAYGFTPAVTEVAVQEDEAVPGRYRIVNPFAATRSNTLTPSVHGSHDHYMYFDASDPDCVILEEGPVGYITETDGDFRISSRAAQEIADGMTKAEVKALGHGGIMKDCRITFPFQAYVYAGFLTEGADFWMNVNFTQTTSGYTDGPMYLDLTDVLGISDATAEPADDAVTYYNLQGIPVADPQPGQVVIRRSAGSAAKIIIR